jgi:photosystem II stability/assembly factor-like uncharacterized protein
MLEGARREGPHGRLAKSSGMERLFRTRLSLFVLAAATAVLIPTHTLAASAAPIAATASPVPAPAQSPAPAAPATSAAPAVASPPAAATRPAAPAVPSPSPTATGPFSGLDFRTIGPGFGRIDTVTGVAGNPKVYYAGGLGGLLRSTDAGTTWQEVFEHKPVSSIGAVAVAPSNPAIIYVGTGEPNLRSDIAFGDGVWRSDDGGDSWRHLGLDGTAQIAGILIDPQDPNTVFVAAVGDPYRAGPDRGVYKTTDGGRHWRRVLFTGPTTGASSIVMQPGHPEVLFAGMWQVTRNSHMLVSGGPEGGLFASRDGGDHWTKVTGHGLPSGLTGRIGLAFAPSAPATLYALIESREGVLWRSQDAGATWQMVSRDHRLAQRPFYFSELAVDPTDAQHVYFMSVQLMESRDGGRTAHPMSGTPGGDNHQMWIDPNDSRRLIVGSDQTIMLTQNAGRTWFAPALLVAQAYHVATDDRIPYTVCSEDQDAGAACGPSNDLVNADIEPDDWFAPGGGESGWIVFDRRDDNIIYGSGYEGELTRYDRRTNQAAVISPWPEDTSGWGAASLKYRFQWTAPLATAPWNPRALYFGGNRLFVTYDRGRTWRIISPDLTRNVKAWQRHSGGPITGDNTGPEYYDTIFTVRASPLRAGELWVGTDDGLAWLTLDDGRHWRRVTPRGVGMPPFARIDDIEPSPHDPAVAFMAVENHEAGDRTPYLYATEDYGRTWRSIAGNLPRDSYARVVKEDPVRRNLLYAGTETGLWLSFDGGRAWQQLLDNFPTVPVYDLTVARRFDDLVVATHGRANLILDDLIPLQDFGPAVTEQTAYLFRLRPAYRFASVGEGFTSPGSGENPPYGADVNFYLRRTPPKKAAIKIEIVHHGAIIRTMNVDNAHAGINRVWWDLRYDGTTIVKNVAVEGEAGFTGPLAVPGVYTVRLLVAGRQLDRPVTVLPDPRSSAPAAALQAQLAFLLRIRNDITRIGRAITALRSARDAAARIARKAPAPVTRAVEAFEEQIAQAERALYQPADIEGEDDIREPIHVYEKLNSLAGFAGSADVAPRPADVAELNYLEGEMRTGLAKARLVLTAGTAALNARLLRAGVPSLRLPSGQLP